RPQPPLDERAGGRRLGLTVEIVERLASDLGVDTALAEFAGEGTASQPAAVVSAGHPGAGERGVVDEADLVIPVEDGRRDLRVDAPLAHRRVELRPGTRTDRQLPQANLPRRLVRIGRLRRCPGTPTAIGRPRGGTAGALGPVSRSIAPRPRRG